MRVEYIGKSVADLGVRIPGQPATKWGFKYGERFRKQGPDNAFIENVVGVNPARDAGADVLWSPQGEFDDEIIVAVVDQRCLDNSRLLDWLKRELTLTPDSPSNALVFVPESKLGSTTQTFKMNQRLKKRGIDAEAIPYYPVLVS